MNVSLRGVENEGRRHAAEQGQAVAWVESPLQLLCAVEAHHAGLLGPVTTVVPRAGLPALRLTLRELDRLGLPEGLRVAEPAARAPRPGRVWAVGDAFSGRVQLALVTALPGRTVLVDDGLATIRLLELLVARGPLLRARGTPGLGRKVLATAAGLRLRTRRPTVFTALPVPMRPRGRGGGHGRPARTARLRLAARPARPPAAAGAHRRARHLARTQRAHPPRPLPALAGADRRARRVLPHRREDPRDLDRVRGIAGLTVYDTGAPAEMTLRDLRPDQRVLSLPSTAVTSLRVLLSARGVRVETVDVPDDWWTASAVPSLRSHLQLFAHEPQPHLHDPGKVVP